MRNNMENNAKKRLPKWAVALIIIGAVFTTFLFTCISCAGCAACVSEEIAQETGAGSGNEAIYVSLSDSAEKTENNAGKFNAVPVSCRIGKNYADDPVVIVKYAFTNNSDSPASFIWSVDSKVFQNGIELTAEYFMDDVDAALENAEIKPGVTLELEKAYQLRDTTAQLEISIAEYLSLDEKTATYYMDIA